MPLLRCAAQEGITVMAIVAWIVAYWWLCLIIWTIIALVIGVIIGLGIKIADNARPRPTSSVKNLDPAVDKTA